MKNIIKFASDTDIHSIPKPSRNQIPDWYKKSSLYDNGSNDILKQSGFNNTFKRCVPFLDALLTGYTAELWCDVLVKKNSTGSVLEFRTDRPPIEERPLSGSLELPVPAGHNVNRYAWKVPYFIETPKGYSCLITQPFNRFDLPFTTLSGVVDTDQTMYAGNLPFFLKTDFQGVIEKGTPIFQVFPFKREDWDSEEDKQLIIKGQANQRKSFAHLYGWYKKNVWTKKEYN